jgi:hypothetical protein
MATLFLCIVNGGLKAVAWVLVLEANLIRDPLPQARADEPNESHGS